MTAQEIRSAYLKFFTDRGHSAIPRALLVPNNDPTTLFTGSGMQPLIPYLLGESHPDGVRLVNSQTCLRAQDIEEIGDNRHTTFFEMLGNWSLGDYFKKEQLPWFYQFLFEEVGLDPNRIFATCFIGDDSNGIPKDTESAAILKEIFKKYDIDAQEFEIGSEADGYQKGMPDGARIFYYDASKNWWCRSGKIDQMPAGEPGGPDSEVFYLFDFIEHDPKWGEKCHPNCDCGRFIEIGNSVFMEYVKRQDGFEKLPKSNVDFGGGLERISMAAINSPDAFKVSVLWPIVESLQKLSGKSYESHTESMRVIVDHLRGAAFLAVDGVVPSNKEQGYVMRRLMRRAIRYAFDLGIEQDLSSQVVPIIADLYQQDYPEVAEHRQEIIDVLVREEKIFRQTLRQGLREFEKLFNRQASDSQSDGERVFKLYDTYGFPTELTIEEAYKKDIKLQEDWMQVFESHMKTQRERSQTASKGTFKGGLGGQKDIHKKYHTATHLMYAALRNLLGESVIQRGSNITEERLRFDFTHHEKVSKEFLQQVEDIVNQQIDKDLKVSFEEHPTRVAIDEMHATGHFGERYGEVVKVYRMQGSQDSEPFSFEICGGPHVEHTGQLAEEGKKFKILKEEASSAGIRRIKAMLV